MSENGASENGKVDVVVEAIKAGIAEDAPEELKKLILLTANASIDYKKAINNGIKKRGTEARKSLGEIKKLALEMRKIVIASRKKE